MTCSPVWSYIVGRKDTVMKQLKAPHAPVIGQLPFNSIECGFMRGTGGRVFFLNNHGRQTLMTVVFEDGTFAVECDFVHPGTIVDLVHLRDLGVAIDIINPRYAEPKTRVE